MAAKKTPPKARQPKATRPHMPGYGLPKHKKGLLPWKWAVDRLTKSRQYWIATVRPDRAPHVMVVWGLWWKGRFCFSTGCDSVKARNLYKNPHCVICNENADEAVIVEGTANRIKDVKRIRKFIGIYQKKYRFDMSAMAEGMTSLKEPIYEVRPRKVFGQDHASFAKTATRWLFPV